MKNLIYKYRIDNHKKLNKTLLNFFDTLPAKVGDQDYNLGITKFDGHNHFTSPFLPPEWQYQDPLNAWNDNDAAPVEVFEQTPWFVFEEQQPHVAYKKIFLDAAKDKLHEFAKLHIQPDITGLSYKHNIMHMWYHQMQRSDYINWDNHQYCQWSAVYFIEIPDKKYITEFLDPHTQKVIQPDASVGDMIIFPSWLLHRAPKMLTDQRKSIIAWNMDVSYVFPDDQIKNLKETHPGNWAL